MDSYKHSVGACQSFREMNPQTNEQTFNIFSSASFKSWGLWRSIQGSLCACIFPGEVLYLLVWRAEGQLLTPSAVHTFVLQHRPTDR